MRYAPILLSLGLLHRLGAVGSRPKVIADTGDARVPSAGNHGRLAFGVRIWLKPEIATIRGLHPKLFEDRHSTLGQRSER